MVRGTFDDEHLPQGCMVWDWSSQWQPLTLGRGKVVSECPASSTVQGPSVPTPAALWTQRWEGPAYKEEDVEGAGRNIKEFQRDPFLVTSLRTLAKSAREPLRGTQQEGSSHKACGHPYHLSAKLITTSNMKLAFYVWPQVPRWKWTPINRQLLEKD